MAETLPRQHDDGLAGPWSIKADNQLRVLLEAGLGAALGAGVVSGGAVIKTGAFAVEVAAATKLLTEGVLLTLDAAVPRTGIPASNTSYLWGLVTRTKRNRQVATTVDAWSLVLSTNTTGVPPAALSIPLAVIVADGAGITSIDEPAGKYLRATNPLAGTRDTLAAGEVAAVDTGHQAQVLEQMTVRGLLVVRGKFFVRGVS